MHKMNSKMYLLGLSILTVLLTAVVASTMSTSIVDVYAESQKFAIQKTETSTQDPLPGHEGHQIVIALPPLSDNKMYSGKVTYAASKPVEVVVLNSFNATAVDETHGQPLNAPFGNTSVAISLMPQFNGEFNAGSLAFTGSALAFHTKSGEPFSVSYGTTGYILEQMDLPE